MSAEPNGKVRRVDKDAAGDEAAQDDDPLVVAFNAVDQHQKELEQLEDECAEQILEVELKFNAKRGPLYAARSKILATIPEFWLTVFLNHDTLKAQLLERDRQILRHCSNLDVVQTDIKTGYSIVLYFAKENPYFSNPSLTKSFEVDSTTGDVTPSTTTIHWKDKTEAKPEGRRKRCRDEGQTSFFEWFTQASEQDVELGELLKEELWPNPLQFYQGEMVFVTEGEDGEELEGAEAAGDGAMDDVQVADGIEITDADNITMADVQEPQGIELDGPDKITMDGEEAVLAEVDVEGDIAIEGLEDIGMDVAEIADQTTQEGPNETEAASADDETIAEIESGGAVDGSNTVDENVKDEKTSPDKLVAEDDIEQELNALEASI